MWVAIGISALIVWCIQKYDARWKVRRGWTDYIRNALNTALFPYQGKYYLFQEDPHHGMRRRWYICGPRGPVGLWLEIEVPADGKPVRLCSRADLMAGLGPTVASLDELLRRTSEELARLDAQAA